MKKTMLLTSLIAVAAMAVGTTGRVEFTGKTESTFEKGTNKTEITHKFGELKAETEVKVKETGFSFGGTFKVKDIPVFTTKTGKDAPKFELKKSLEDTNIWAKYELPEIKGVNSSLKATYKDLTKLNLEADANYMIKGIKVGINSNTSFPIITEEKVDYGKVVESTHKIYAEAKELYMLKDVKANVVLTNTYNQIQPGAEAKEVLATAIKNVSGEVEATYDKVKDLKLTGKVNFKVNVADKGVEFKRSDIKLISDDNKALYIHSYDLIATYTGVKNLTLEANPFVAHVGLKYEKTDEGKVKRDDTAIYGVAAKATYKMLDEKLTLTGKTLLSGATVVNVDETKTKPEEIKTVNTCGHFMFGANAKYDYKVTDKFTVSPEFDAMVKFDTNDTKKTVVVDKVDLTLTPKVSAEYKPVENLTLKGGIELPINFKGLEKDKFYKSTSVKTSLNVKYTW